FGFAKTVADQTDYRIKKKDVYSCDEVVIRSVGSKDYAVIKLDRMVAGRTPLNIRRQGQVQVGERLMIIGHPMGIPSKIAEGGSVMSNNDRIRASVDAFAANSGSVILNMSTGDVEGILVAGEADFVFQNGCRVEKRCRANCGGEVITPISDIAELIPNVTYDNPVCPN
ncbi:MAG: trypsin-like peptidase domain-containing protein, partial [Bdellovibrionales bacterium]|nr:serine protease [Bdellovibrionales bacterium]NQZ20189.1 trypsin-like peptidase domain-containing protein [Bdellovibrionales bacterium]